MALSRTVHMAFSPSVGLALWMQHSGEVFDWQDRERCGTFFVSHIPDTRQGSLESKEYAFSVAAARKLRRVSRLGLALMCARLFTNVRLISD